MNFCREYPKWPKAARRNWGMVPHALFWSTCAAAAPRRPGLDGAAYLPGADIPPQDLESAIQVRSGSARGVAPNADDGCRRAHRTDAA
jgi:hypothetical protein